jgi:hypothetical protein
MDLKLLPEGKSGHGSWQVWMNIENSDMDNEHWKQWYEKNIY